MPHSLFGTDGIRGTAGTYPLDAATIRRVGAALVKVMLRNRQKPGGRVLIGRDTRESGEWIERELAHGAASAGATVFSVGVAPTPAVAYLTRAMQFDSGVVISASHNPYQDNGIKVFSGSGEKYGEHLEERIEHLVADASWTVSNGDAPEVNASGELRAYLDHAREVLPNPRELGPLRLVVDCANGAMTTVAPKLFRELGFDATVLAATPDGAVVVRVRERGAGTHHVLGGRAQLARPRRPPPGFPRRGVGARRSTLRGISRDGDGLQLDHQLRKRQAGNARQRPGDSC